MYTQVHHCHWGYCHDLIDARTNCHWQCARHSQVILRQLKYDLFGELMTWVVTLCILFHICFFWFYRDLKLMTKTLSVFMFFLSFFVAIFLWLSWFHEIVFMVVGFFLVVLPAFWTTSILNRWHHLYRVYIQVELKSNSYDTNHQIYSRIGISSIKCYFSIFQPYIISSAWRKSNAPLQWLTQHITYIVWLPSSIYSMKEQTASGTETLRFFQV